MKVYLLSIEELQKRADAGANVQVLYEKCLKKMDTHRLEKVRRLKTENARNLAIGAGLLLQLAWADCVDTEMPGIQRENIQHTKAQEHGKQTGKFEIAIVTLKLSDLLQWLASDCFPVEIPYQYGDKGKPDFAKGDYHFNLSHSGDYVCLAVDKQQIGIDIQKMRPLEDLKVAERFFTIREQEALRACADKQTQELLFYSIWVKKEAYAKLTGDGIGTGVKAETLTEEFMTAEMVPEAAQMCGKIVWNMLQSPAGYRMAACQFRDK